MVTGILSRGTTQPNSTFILMTQPSMFSIWNDFWSSLHPKKRMRMVCLPIIWLVFFMVKTSNFLQQDPMGLQLHSASNESFAVGLWWSLQDSRGHPVGPRLRGAIPFGYKMSPYQPVTQGRPCIFGNFLDVVTPFIGVMTSFSHQDTAWGH